jgi:hypothetical protein
MIVTEGYRGMRLRIFGDTSNDDCDIEIYHVDRSHARGDSSGDYLYTTKLFLGVDTILISDGTIGAGVVANNMLLPSEYFADTYTTLAIDDYGTALLNYTNGVANVYSPTSQATGELWISDLANAHGIVVTIDTLNTGNYFGYLYKLDV